MPLIEISDDQVIKLAQSLPDNKKQELLKILITQPWESWQKLTLDSREKARLLCQERGFDWDKMTEDEREEFIDNLLHED
jgi:hypothetical protein